MQKINSMDFSWHFRGFLGGRKRGLPAKIPWLLTRHYSLWLCPAVDESFHASKVKGSGLGGQGEDKGLHPKG